MSSFDVFWQIYPRKVGKLEAQRAYEKAIKKTPDHVIRAAALRHADECKMKEAQFIPHPATWLNQGRWMDEQKKSVAGYWWGPSPQFPPEKRAPGRLGKLNWANVLVAKSHPLYSVMCERSQQFDADEREYRHCMDGIWVSRLWLDHDGAAR